MEYKLEDGSTVPLFEAEYDTSFKVYKSDRRTSVIGHPTRCIEAKGILKCENVVEAYIGSGGDAYIVYEMTASRPFRHAVHFTIPADARHVRDSFEIRGAPATQILMLKVPSKGRTIKHRRKLNKARRMAVKNGAEVKHREKPQSTRMQRIGVRHRPRAKIKADVVSIPIDN